MRSITEHFVRDLFGSWLCIQAVDLELFEGRVQIAAGTRLTRGTAFRGVDLVRLLDEHWENDRQRFYRDA
jgi:hypothetical protein